MTSAAHERAHDPDELVRIILRGSRQWEQSRIPTDQAMEEVSTAFEVLHRHLAAGGRLPRVWTTLPLPGRNAPGVLRGDTGYVLVSCGNVGCGPHQYKLVPEDKPGSTVIAYHAPDQGDSTF